MKIKGKVFLFFEQSGTFKREFERLGIPAEDYDIQNNFGETDHVTDLFAEIVRAYEGGASIFDAITKDDLIMAFFPCIYFCENNQLFFTGKHHNLRNLTKKEKADAILERSRERQYFYEIALKMFTVCDVRGLRLIVENPFASRHFLVENFPFAASLIDRNRSARGDFYNKPTQYWFINSTPTHGRSFTSAGEHKTIGASKAGKNAGICSEERSMISPTYARNFICDFIIGKENEHTLRDLFSNE